MRTAVVLGVLCLAAHARASSPASNATTVAPTVGALRSLLRNGTSPLEILLAADGTFALDGNALHIERVVTIDGNGATLDAQGRSRIFTVSAGGLTLRNARLTGGAVHKPEDLGELCAVCEAPAFVAGAEDARARSTRIRAMRQSTSMMVAARAASCRSVPEFFQARCP